jgi:hypothetical protein
MNNISGYVWPVIVALLIMCVSFTICFSVYQNFDYANTQIEQGLVETIIVRLYSVDPKKPILSYDNVYVKVDDLPEIQKNNQQFQRDVLFNTQGRHLKEELK